MSTPPPSPSHPLDLQGRVGSQSRFESLRKGFGRLVPLGRFFGQGLGNHTADQAVALPQLEVLADLALALALDLEVVNGAIAANMRGSARGSSFSCMSGSPRRPGRFGLTGVLILTPSSVVPGTRR